MLNTLEGKNNAKQRDGMPSSMTVLSLLLALWATVITGLYIRGHNQMQVLRGDVEALAQWAKEITGVKP